MKLHNFNSFVNEAKKNKKNYLDELFADEETQVKMPKKKPAKKATTKIDQDGDGDSDFADAKMAQYKAGGMDKKKAFKKSRKFNK
jgi:hypothetical protein